MDKQVKQFHIMTVGNSLINNFKHERNQSDINEVSLYDYLIAKEKMACAETNSFISFLKQYNVDSQICTIYLIGTDSEDNKMILNLLIRYFKEIIKVNEVLKGKTIPPMTSPENETINGIKELLDYELRQVLHRQREGYEVYFCASGGYKPHIIFTAIAGYLSNCKIYYINEQSSTLITLPPMLLTLKPIEVEIIKKIYNREDSHIVINESTENKNWFNKNKSDIEFLNSFDFITITRDKNTGEPVKIFLTEKAKLYIEKHIKNNN